MAVTPRALPRRSTEATLDWYLGDRRVARPRRRLRDPGRGAALVESIEGDYWNVVGLPVPALLRLVPDLLRG